MKNILRNSNKTIDKDIFRLSVPAIVSNITVPLLGLCDTAISGHLGSDLFLAAIAVGTVMLNVIFWMLGFLRGGTTGLTAIAYGTGSNQEIAKVLYRALFISLIGGTLLIALQKPLFSFLSLVASPDKEIIPLVRSYFDIRIWGSPAMLATMAISGWFVGMQTTLFPMIIAIGMNIANIIVSFLLAFPAGLGFEGVAWGTLISNWFGLLLSIGCMWWFRKGKPLPLIFSELLKGGLWKYFSVNGNLFLRSFFIICVTMGVTAAGARLGSRVLAINVIVMQFFQFFSFFMDGFAFSGEALIGRRLGEGNFQLLKKTSLRLVKWSLFTGLAFSFFYFFTTGKIASLLTDSIEIQEGVAQLVMIITLIPIVSCWAFIFDGFYVGLAETNKMMISTLLAAIAFFAIAFLKYDNGIMLGTSSNLMIWAGFLSYLLIRGLYLGFMWPSTVKSFRTDALK
ncbi:MAG: MATE family efflux transporter [Muribaculaceae bacterium]|nr:MATE family efflux transporter [Muribaculaceae bacterium]